MNIFDPFFFQASQSPNKPACAFPGGFVTYGELATAASAASATIASAGFKRNELVAIAQDNPLFQIIIILALGRLAIPSITLVSRNPEHYADLPIKGYIGERSSDVFKSIKTLIADQNWFMVRMNANIQPSLRGFSTKPYELARITLSSGTTGFPKAMEITAACMEQRLSRVTINPTGQRTLTMLHLSTAWGFLIMLRTLRTGGTYCFAPLAQDVLNLCGYAGVQELWVSPGQLAELIEVQAEKERFLTLESVTVGGSSMPPKLLAEAYRRLCKNIVLTYGATETGPVASAPASLLQETPGAVGKVFPWVDVEIVDDEDNPLGFNKNGIIRIKAPDCVTAYTVVDTASEGVFKDGWFYPGDLGALHPDGLLVVSGRSSEIINRGGMKIAPAVIEEQIKGHPRVDDVAVVGVNANDGSPQIWAAVVASKGFSTTELRSFCDVKLGAAAPDRFFQVEDIPRNSAGKTVSGKLRQHLQKLAK